MQHYLPFNVIFPQSIIQNQNQYKEPFYFNLKPLLQLIFQYYANVKIFKHFSWSLIESTRNISKCFCYYHWKIRRYYQINFYLAHGHKIQFWSELITKGLKQNILALQKQNEVEDS